MLRLFICPKCGRLRTVSRRTDVVCFKCSGNHMVSVKLDYKRYCRMNEEERKDYIESWMYIHKNTES